MKTNERIVLEKIREYVNEQNEKAKINVLKEGGIRLYYEGQQFQVMIIKCYIDSMINIYDLEEIEKELTLCEEIKRNAVKDFDHLTPEQRVKFADLPRAKRIENEITNK